MALRSGTSPKIVVDTRLEGSQLWIRLSGEYGHGAENLRSGRAVQNALKESLERHNGEVSEVVVDYSQVNKVGGDGPIWSVGSALQQRLRVRCVASGGAYKSLTELFSVTKIHRMIQLERCGDPYGPSSVTDHHVDLYITQQHIDNGASVELDVPGVAMLTIELPTIAQDGFRIRIPDATPDGGDVSAHLHVI